MGFYTSSEVQYKLAYEIAPIMLTGGIASNIPGGMLPVLSIVQGASFSGLTSGGAEVDLDHFFAYFYPLPGSSLQDYQIGNYPFANQQVAANAIIRQPLVVSLLMRIPVREPGGYGIQQAVMTSLKYTLDQHSLSGGTYTVMTPCFPYTNCILTGLHDVSPGNTLQAQTEWKWDFVKPLVTLEDATAAQNAMMSQLSSGVQTTGALSGSGAVGGVPPTFAAPALLPPAAASGAGAVAGQFP